MALVFLITSGKIAPGPGALTKATSHPTLEAVEFRESAAGLRKKSLELREQAAIARRGDPNYVVKALLQLLVTDDVDLGKNIP